MNELTSLMQTETPGIVGETLDFCLYECSIEDAPDAEEVAQWRDILKARGGKFVRFSKRAAIALHHFPILIKSAISGCFSVRHGCAQKYLFKTIGIFPIKVFCLPLYCSQ